MRGIKVAQTFCYSCRQSDFFILSKTNIPALGPRILFGGYRLSFPGVNFQGYAVDYSAQSTPDINTGTPSFVPTYRHQCDNFNCSYDIPRF